MLGHYRHKNDGLWAILACIVFPRHQHKTCIDSSTVAIETGFPCISTIWESKVGGEGLFKRGTCLISCPRGGCLPRGIALLENGLSFKELQLSKSWPRQTVKRNIHMYEKAYATSILSIDFLNAMTNYRQLKYLTCLFVHFFV